VEFILQNEDKTPAFHASLAFFDHYKRRAAGWRAERRAK
jgi:hypothetical protein